MATTLRTIIFDPPARVALLNLYGGAELVDDACAGFEFILARNPESGVHIGDNVWMIEMEGVGVWETAVAYYGFDSTTVTVYDVVT